MNRILVVDDDLSMREFLELMLVREGYEVQLAPDGYAALALAQENRYDLVITDIRMKGADGIEVLKGVKHLDPEAVVILISAFSTVETAVTAMREGAYDFIPKPFRMEELKAVVASALAHRTPEAERRVLEAKVKEGCHFGSLVGLSSQMLKVYDLIRRAAQTTTNILVTGESGTGKELVARAIHDNSPRARERFQPINCGGMPEQLIESELFGYRKGAFTGATMDKPGLFELAHLGTIFLDEVGELSLTMQVKLLRVAQDKTYRALGDTREKLLDVRFIAATNKNLEAEVMAGRFREDLYYRLNVINIHLPALRERFEDIPLLAQFFLDKYARTMGKDLRKISSYALDILSRYDFPGNVRELENIIERSVALEQSNIILPESLTLASFKQSRRISAAPDYSGDPPARTNGLTRAPTAPGAESMDAQLEALEKRLLLRALDMAGGNRQKAARYLKTSLRSLRYRLAKYDLADLDSDRIHELRIQADLQAGPFEPTPKEKGLNLETMLQDAERRILEKALDECGGSKTRAAARLGISFRSLRYRLTKGNGQEPS